MNRPQNIFWKFPNPFSNVTLKLLPILVKNNVVHILHGTPPQFHSETISNFRPKPKQFKNRSRWRRREPYPCSPYEGVSHQWNCWTMNSRRSSFNKYRVQSSYLLPNPNDAKQLTKKTYKHMYWPEFANHNNKDHRAGGWGGLAPHPPPLTKSVLSSPNIESLTSTYNLKVAPWPWIIRFNVTRVYTAHIHLNGEPFSFRDSSHRLKRLVQTTKTRGGKRVFLRDTQNKK